VKSEVGKEGSQTPNLTPSLEPQAPFVKGVRGYRDSLSNLIELTAPLTWGIFLGLSLEKGAKLGLAFIWNYQIEDKTA
jgi:hypothetical protein